MNDARKSAKTHDATPDLADLAELADQSLPQSSPQERLIAERLQAHIEVTRQLHTQTALYAHVARLLIDVFARGNKVLLCGNGGSAADAQHIAAEFVGRFSLERPALPAEALSVNVSSVTALGNDYGFDQVFTRQVEAFGARGDVCIGLSTSGNSRNVIEAFRAAHDKGITTVAMTGAHGGRLREVADLCMCVPSTDTPRIQEHHILIGHILCELVEQALFGETLVATRASHKAAAPPRHAAE